MSITYTPPPTVTRFMLSEAFVRVIMGPVGSSKTTGLIMEVLRRAIEQRKGPDGIRRTRWALVRTTLSQIKMTILRDILTWFRAFSTYKVSEQVVTLDFNDVHCEIFLIPLEDEEDQKRLLSMQLTGCLVNECTDVPVELLSAIAGRCGRYPSAADGGCTWHGIIADCNAPTEGSEWWSMFEQDTPSDWEIFFQPGGLDDDAENLEWLTQTPETLKLPVDDPARRAQGRRYYERLARNPSKAWVTRYVHNRYGEDPSGTAVHRESFRRKFHVVKSLDPVPGYPLLIGQDFGRAPCSLICQPDNFGRLLVLEEVIAEDIGLETHMAKNLKPVLYVDRYFGLLMAAVGDPSGRAKGNMLEEDSFDVMRRLGVPAFPASTNDPDKRIAAVDQLLLQQRDGGPAILIDESRCPMLVRALNGAYRFGKTKDGQSKPRPDKIRPYADLADCLQYVCLTVNSGMTDYIAKRIRPRVRREDRRPRVSAAGWT